MWGKWLKRIPWGDLLLLLVVTVLLGWVWVKGYDSGHLDAQRDGDKALAQLQSQFDTYRRESAEQQNEALRTVVARYNARVAAAHKADADFQAKKQQLERENADLKKQIADVTRRWVDESGKSHPVKCVFTRGFVQQYNAALGVTATDSTGHPGTAAAAASGTGKTPRATDTALARLRDSGVSQADVLANVTDNARQCRVWREQVNSLLDHIKGLHQ
ncbi:TPA: OmpH family outer membrane protein [Salmonella enterica subsp. salamae serovar [1],40:z35:e,n,x,z15]|nr:OmpH family outer membrane protein [Salmonella enterica]HCM1997081.1 OmpH family outer membrane protein [Salmonella enterica subsp. salamae serovar [1],40:z35:e,n,x,z15]